jgi:hypothetical protein
MGRKMAVRILSIFTALLLFGMVVPVLSNANVATEAEVRLDPVLINSPPSSTSFGIQNQNEESAITLYFNLTGTCGFSYDTSLQGAILGKKGEPNDTVSMTVQHEPSELGVCSDTLTVYYYAADYVLYEVDVILTAEVVDQLGPSTVIIDGYDTGVENRLNDGVPISDHLAICEENVKNHGQYVRCVALMLRKMHRADVVSKGEIKSIMKAAAHANIPPREPTLEDLVYNGEAVTDLIEACKEGATNKRQYRRCVFDLMKEMKKEGVLETRKQKHQIRKYAARLESHHGQKKK